MIRNTYRPHDRLVLDFPDDGMTRQEFKAECDINTIMAKYGRTGILPTTDRQMKYGDFSDVPDFMTAMNVVSAANEAFAALPATVRRRFDNDPAEFCAFVSDPENIDEVRRLGLAADVPKAPEVRNAGGIPVPAPTPAANDDKPVAPA